MEQRTRSRASTISGGKVYAYEDTSWVLAEYSYDESYATITDWFKKERRFFDGLLPPSDLELESHTVVPFLIHKPTGVFCFQNKYTDGVAARIPGRSPLYAERENPYRASENDYYTQLLLARTNPTRAVFSVPVFIKELVELPFLFRLAAQSFSGIVGKGYLNYKFGWAQFYRDVRTLAGILKALEQRVKEFQSLSQRGGLRRRIRLDRRAYEGPVQTGVPLSTVYGVTCLGESVNYQAMDIYGSCRWRPRLGILGNLEKLTTFNDAARFYFDLDEMDAETMWQMIPFSWLCDYFTEISDFLAANTGRMYVEPFDICIMRHHVSKDQYQVTSITDTATATGGGYHIRETKSRDVWTEGAFPAAPLELLTGNEWKTILALFLSFIK